MAHIPVIWRVQTLVNRVAWFISILSCHKCCVWKGNSYKCVFSKVRCKNNCIHAFSTLILHCVFNNSWQYCNTKRWFVLTQAVSKSGPLFAFIYLFIYFVYFFFIVVCETMTMLFLFVSTLFFVFKLFSHIQTIHLFLYSGQISHQSTLLYWRDEAGSCGPSCSLHHQSSHCDEGIVMDP